MAKFSNKKELQFLSFEELSNHAKFDFKNINFNSAQICNSLLKMFDKGNMLYSSGDEENAYLLLMKFFEAYVKLRASKFYKEDKAFVENMITGDKLNKTISNLENLKESLIYRYKEREAKIFIEKSSLNVDTRRSDLKLPTAGGLNQFVEKKFIRPTEFTELITKSDLKVLIIDTRSKNEFDYSHMNLNILLPDGKNRPQIINVPNELIENVAWKLEETLKKQDTENEALSVSKIFANRKEYDYLILFDKDSTMNSIKADSKLSILKRAVFDFEPNDKLKNEPLVLDGGWNEWLNIYPGYSSSSNSNNLQREFIKSSNYEGQDAFQALKKSFDFDYPTLFNASKPATESPVSQTNQPTVVQQVPAINLSAKTIQPVEVATNADSEHFKQIKTEIKIENDKEIAEPRKQKPIVNRSTKPVEATKGFVNNNSADNLQDTKQGNQRNMFDISSDEDSDEYENDKKKTESDLSTKPSHINKPQALAPHAPQSQLNQTTTTNQSTISLSSNQSITNIKFIPPTVDNEKRVEKNMASNIFETVYKPRFKPIQMKDGASKVLDPNTGIFKIYSLSTQPAPKPNIVKPTNEPSSSSRKEDTELKFIPKPINDISEINPKKSAMKRTLSIPNISNMDDESSTDVRNIENINPKLKTADPPLNNNLNESKPEIDSVKLNAPKISTRKPNTEEKPRVNRETKPMNELTNISRSRIPELLPTYGDVMPGLTGIKNLGNTCFMNSIIQCLNSTPSLVDYFLNGQFIKDLNRTNELGFRGEIADEFAVIVNASWSGHCKTIAPKRFKSILGQFNQQFISNEQQDAQELLLFLLDGLHEDLNRIKKRPKHTDKEDENENISDSEAANLAWNIHLSINNSIIVDLFQGQFKSTVTCSHCHKQSVKFDAFMYLTLPILANKCSLYQCLELFLKPENMTGESKWKCPRCKQYRDAVKKIDIWKLPPILIVHLKRFKYHGLWRDKITTAVDYPIDNLSLDKYVLNNENKRSGGQNYRLYASSNHSGTLDGGHYVAHCRHMSINRWFKYDDTDVKEIIDLAALKTPTSYILFYSRL